MRTCAGKATFLEGADVSAEWRPLVARLLEVYPFLRQDPTYLEFLSEYRESVLRFDSPTTHVYISPRPHMELAAQVEPSEWDGTFVEFADARRYQSIHSPVDSIEIIGYFFVSNGDEPPSLVGCHLANGKWIRKDFPAGKDFADWLERLIQSRGWVL